MATSALYGSSNTVQQLPHSSPFSPLSPLSDLDTVQRDSPFHNRPSDHQLITYRPCQQHYGTFISGFDWTLYGTGSFRRLPRDEEEAVFYLNRFSDKLSRAMQFKKDDIAYYAALEDRTPGLGGKPVRKHWHFLVSCPDSKYVKSVAEQLWLENGLCKIENYDPDQAAAYYIHKLVAEGAPIHDRNLNCLTYKGPTDLIEATKHDPYVPQRVSDKATGEYLVMRGEQEACRP